MLRLASSSTTRAELLSSANIPFIQESIDFDEDSIIATSPKNFVYQATLGKYRVNLEKFGCHDFPLLVADTVVTAQGKILRKAKDETDAREIFENSKWIGSGDYHLYDHKTPKLEMIDFIDTLFFDPFDPMMINMIEPEWRGKAGVCMVEGFCKPYIREVRESTAKIVGRSIKTVIRGWICM